ncbi:ferrous iron transporter B [Tannockella kyphosi]|uniref:ferrous iron transporter B n=1 Tax=Tannockella kyphosi TaxID=2899121 RepID=UPI002010F943|nr:ferrous iron transporter B [Tannockella kyphosi]
MRIALVGNPNSGKTTLYNVLTGSSEKVGNWAGVTVDRKESTMKSSFSDGTEVVAVDLPGAYSMSPFTNEESITSDFVKESNVAAIINVVDATNLSRSLFFTTQMLELGIPVIVALNKSDLAAKKGVVIDVEQLSQKLGCSVVETISVDAGNPGLVTLVQEAIKHAGETQVAPYTKANVDLSDKDAVQTADKERFEFVNEVVAAVEKRATETSEATSQDKIDAIVTNPVVGLVIFAAVMYAVFSISQAYVGPYIADMLCGWIEGFAEVVGGMVESASPFLQALLVDGIIGGVGAVVGFLPLVMVMYFLIALLEDCGYMARVAVVMDPFFKKVGLSGKSIIPMIIGTGCAIPGVMASRTIKNERERRTTAMLTPFMPCGAKLPVIALFAGVFFDNAGWVSPLMYFTGIAIIFLGALLTLQITGHKYRKSFFIIELPEYKIPSLKFATMSMLQRGKEFIIKAGTIILVCNAGVQIMQSFDFSLQLVAETAQDTSILAAISSPFAILFVPLGFGAWQLAAAAITGFIAKENVVGTLAVVYGITNFIDTEELALMSGSTEVATIMGLTKVAALAYLMFNLFTPPCFAAIGAMNAEMRDKKWLWGGIGLQFATGYVVAFFVYQIGTLITLGTLGDGFIAGLVVVVMIVGFVASLIMKTKKEMKQA